MAENNSQDGGTELGPRRLIIVVVTPGDDPQIELDPPESFVTWEMVAALNRAIQILEEEEIIEKMSSAEEDDEE